MQYYIDIFIGSPDSKTDGVSTTYSICAYQVMNLYYRQAVQHTLNNQNHLQAFDFYLQSEE